MGTRLINPLLGLGALLISLTSCINGSSEKIVTIDLIEDMVSPKHYIVTKTDSPLVIDGIANENSWNQASFSDYFIDIEGQKTPKYETQMKMLWDDNYLYVFATLEEPHIWGDITERDAVIFYNNDFEVFIDPSGSTFNYSEIEINALGTVWDLHLDRPYRSGGRANDHWSLEELKTAVSILGTINDPSDIDSLWTVEMAIPMKALAEFKNSRGPLPAEGEHWRINFSRVEWDYDLIEGKYQRKKDTSGKYLPEYNWVWSNQNVINMHEPEKWGVLQFTNALSVAEAQIIEDEFLEVKQVAFSLLRHTKNGKLKELKERFSGEQIRVNAKYNEEDSILVTFHKTLLGFEYRIPFGEETFLINEVGSMRRVNTDN